MNNTTFEKNIPLNNLENFRFWDQIIPKSMNDKIFDKINIKIIISM